MDRVLRWRATKRFIDMKRGELYPEIIAYASELRSLISKVYDLDIVQAQPNFGCNGCIDSFFAYFQRLESQRKSGGFVVALPTYFRYYHKARNLDFNIDGVAFNSDGTYPIKDVLSRVKRRRTGFLLLVSPNNPTGVPITDDELFTLLNGIPDDLIVAIDRTCVNIDAEISSKNLMGQFKNKNLVIFHSFSKYHGLSHQRIGFSLVSNPALAVEMEKYLPFGLNLHSALLAIDILATEGPLRPGDRIVNNIRKNKKRMKAFLEKQPDYSCSDFKSNYAVLTIPESVSTHEFHDRMMKRNISVMPGHDLPEVEKRSIRIHCGGPPKHFEMMVNEIEGWGN